MDEEIAEDFAIVTELQEEFDVGGIEEDMELTREHADSFEITSELAEDFER